MTEGMIKTTRKIGRNRGRPRLWIEGKHLEAAGFKRGDRWQLHPTAHGFIIAFNPNGSRKVSGKADKPIIDIVGAALGVLAEGWERAELRYNTGSKIIILQGSLE